MGVRTRIVGIDERVRKTGLDEGLCVSLFTTMRNQRYIHHHKYLRHTIMKFSTTKALVPKLKHLCLYHNCSHSCRTLNYSSLFYSHLFAFNLQHHHQYQAPGVNKTRWAYKKFNEFISHFIYELKEKSHSSNHVPFHPLNDFHLRRRWSWASTKRTNGNLIKSTFNGR